MDTPSLDENLGFVKRHEDLRVEQLVAKFAIEGLVVTIPPRRSRLDVECVDANTSEPIAHPWWRGLDDVRQRVLVDMSFNLGIRRFLGFKKMLRHVAARAWDLAADEMLDSRWADQVGMRTRTLSDMMRTGQD